MEGKIDVNQMKASIKEGLTAYANTPQEKKTPLEEVYFDIAASLRDDDTLEYRIVYISFKERRLCLLRHGKAREEYPFTSINTVVHCSSPTQWRMKVQFCERPSVTFLMQNEADYINLFGILRAITTDNNTVLYKEDYQRDVCTGTSE